MDWRTVFVVLWMLLPYPSTAIKLDGGGYVDITIAIGAKVKQDDTLIDKIKEMVTDGSFYLYHALDKKVYLKDATILVPSHWSCKSCSKARTESFEKAKIKIDHAKLMEPRTKLYGECGKGGEYIHFTPDFLLNDSAIQMYGPRGKVFLHEWAHLRWGVYDEYNEEKPFYLSNGRVEYTRCTTNIEGQIFEVNGGSPQSCPNFSIRYKTTIKTKVPIVSASWKNRKATTCTVCEENCHELDCWWVSSPKNCEVMRDGFCTVCTRKCHYSKHVKDNKKYVIDTSDVVTNYNELKKGYEIPQNKRFSVAMDDLDKDLKEIEDQKYMIVFKAYKTIKHLSQVALKPDSAFTLQHLDFFIPRVREAGKEDWAQELEEMRRQATAEEANKDVVSYLKAGLIKLFLGDK